MAEKSQEKKFTMPERPPGVLTGVEFYKSGKVALSKDESTAVRELIRKINYREQAARREEIILDWKKHLYDRGLQHLLPMQNGGWQLPEVGSGYHPNDQYSRSMFTANIYNPFMQLIISVLTREVPTVTMEPDDPDSDVDITTANGAEKLETRIDRDNNLKTKMEEMARFLYLDGRCMFFSTYELDGQRFGYESDLEEEEDETVPETEEAIGEEERASGEGMPETDSDSRPMVGDAGRTEASETESSGENKESDATNLGKPRGHECIHVGGALEWKLPMKCQSLAQATYADRRVEIPVSLARAKYPDVADEIKPSSGGPSGDDIDRLARINVQLGVLDNFNTTGTQDNDVTEQKTFLRPCELLDIPDEEMRESLLNRFAQGMYVTYCGQTYCESYNVSMDDHLTLVFANPGDGMHRPGLGDWLVPIQEVLNNWLELANDYFIRGVPNKWMDNEMFNVQALKDQTNVPGSVHPFDREPGVQMAEVIFEETPIQFPPELQSFIQDFKGELAELLSGGVPAMSGTGDTSATDTFGGMLVQRDQALGRMGLPWRQIKEAIASVKRQAIQMLARNHDGAVTVVGNEAVVVELEQMKGNFHVFADVDENIPASFTQKQNAIAKVFSDAVTNPQLGELLFNPDNMEVFQKYGMQELCFPQIEAREKQLGEATELLKGEPLPNPQVLQLQQQIKQIQDQAKAAAAVPNGINEQQLQAASQQITQIQQQIAQLPPQVSTVPVRLFDDDATELYVCQKILNSPRGRELANGDDQEKAAYANLELHAKEHQAAMAQKKAGQPPTTAKPPSVSINIKDLPPAEAAAASNAAGLGGTAQDFGEQDAAEAAAKHPGPGGVTVAGQ